MQNQIDGDLKKALLSGDKHKTETLRGLKGAILNEAISLGAKDTGLNDEQTQKVLRREAKKRAEAAQMYEQAGETERAKAELSEKEMIDAYLPAQMEEADVAKAVEEEIAKLESPAQSDMGKIIGAVKAQLGAQADGAVIAKLVRQNLEQKN